MKSFFNRFASDKGFATFGLNPEILKAIADEGYTKPTPIQAQTIAPVLAQRDLLGCAQTGTGKTAAFALPTLHLLAQGRRTKGIRALVLTPTRELAVQVADSYKTYGNGLSMRSRAIFGGVGQQPQIQALNSGLDVLVATPGRLLDLHSQGFVDFRELEILILDEADRMLDMGFLPDVKRILRLLPKKRQNLLFSATMPRDIHALSLNLLKDPVKVEVAPVSSTSERVTQSVFHVHKADKRALLLHLLEEPNSEKVLVFTRTKAIANRVAKFLVDRDIESAAIHGNKSQSARQKALNGFRDGTLRVLVASDLAARGLDVDNITHVINFELPNVPETYVHRIGRTGRASAVGIAYSFCDPEERGLLRVIEKTIAAKVPVAEDHPFVITPERTRELKKILDDSPPTRRPQNRRPHSRRPQEGNRSKRGPGRGKPSGRPAPKSKGPSR